MNSRIYAFLLAEYKRLSLRRDWGRGEGGEGKWARYDSHAMRRKSWIALTRNTNNDTTFVHKLKPGKRIAAKRYSFQSLKAKRTFIWQGTR